jgi:hypothetical protein
MVIVTKDIIKRGILSQELPTKPKTSVHNILYKKQQKQEKTPQEIHQLLKNNIITTTDDSWIPYEGDNLEELAKSLSTGFEVSKTREGKMISFYLDYGKLLTKAFLLYKSAKIRNMSWKNWLEENVGIKESYARKLRAL